MAILDDTFADTKPWLNRTVIKAINPLNTLCTRLLQDEIQRVYLCRSRYELLQKTDQSLLKCFTEKLGLKPHIIYYSSSNLD